MDRIQLWKDDVDRLNAVGKIFRKLIISGLIFSIIALTDLLRINSCLSKLFRRALFRPGFSGHSGQTSTASPSGLPSRSATGDTSVHASTDTGFGGLGIGMGIGGQAWKVAGSNKAMITMDPLNFVRRLRHRFKKRKLLNT